MKNHILINPSTRLKNLLNDRLFRLVQITLKEIKTVGVSLGYISQAESEIVLLKTCHTQDNLCKIELESLPPSVQLALFQIVQYKFLRDFLTQLSYPVARPCIKHKQLSSGKHIHKGPISGTHILVVAKNCLIGLKVLSRGGKSCRVLRTYTTFQDQCGCGTQKRIYYPSIVRLGPILAAAL